MIRGGYILQARKIDDSEIAFKPPHFREIFNWLYRQANHSDNDKFKRGQCFRSINDIQEGLKWFVGYRKCTYTKDQCEKALKWLRKADMIETTKATRGMFITICNYEFYQDPKNYESNNESHKKATRKQQGSHTKNKNDNNDKNDKNIIITWRDDFEIYKSMLDKEYNRIINDQVFISKQQELNPGINIKLSLQKAKENYWEREVGWKKKKSSRSKTIDWEQTFINALSLPSNRVWKPKDEIEHENNGPRIIKDW